MGFAEILNEIIAEADRVYNVKRAKYGEITEVFDEALKLEALNEVTQIIKINEMRF